ncbi:hypothetical protein ACR0ST_09700 [Aliidiomarina sp. Khilg15.8]
MTEAKAVLVRVTIGDNLTCSFPEGNEVASLENGEVRFENFTNLTAEVRFKSPPRNLRVEPEGATAFETKDLGDPGTFRFTIHEVIDGDADDTVYGEGSIIVQV